MSNTAAVQQVPSSRFTNVVLAALSVGLLGAWAWQLAKGMEVTGLGQQVTWGLYIAGFFTAAGAGAALLVLAAVRTKEENAQVSTIHLALACFVCAGILITLDVGSPAVLWRLAVAGRWRSLMTWDFWLLLATSAASIAALLARSGRRFVLWLAATLAVALVVVEAWMLSSMAARPAWGGIETVVSFLVGAACAGLAIAAAREQGEAARERLEIALWANAALVVLSIASKALASDERTTVEVATVLSGGPAPAFWAQLLLGLALPIVLVRQGRSGIAVATLVLAGVLLEKWWTLASGLAHPWLALPEGHYAPSLVEVIAVVGAAALAVLVARALPRVVPAKAG